MNRRAFLQSLVAVPLAITAAPRELQVGDVFTVNAVYKINPPSVRERMAVRFVKHYDTIADVQVNRFSTLAGYGRLYNDHR